MLPAAGCGTATTTVAYDEEVNAHRASREEKLSSEYGWLSVIGLHWLEQGETRFGSRQGLPIVLPADVSPPMGGWRCS